MQFVVQVYLPSFMFVIVSWVSFLVKPEVVPGRMAMLVTLFLVLINIFNSVREGAPISSRLNAVDLYLVVCIFFVFGKLCTKIKQLAECISSGPTGVCCNPLAAQEEAEASDEAGAGDQEPPGPGAGHRPRRQEAAHEETPRSNRTDGEKTGAGGQHRRVGHVDISPHLRAVQRHLLDTLQALDQ